MDGLEWLGVADNGINLKSVRNMDLYCRMNGRDPSRLRYLDLNGVWNRDSPSMKYIFSTFNQLNHVNSSRSEIKELKHSPLSVVRYDKDDHPEELSDGSAPSPPLRKRFYEEKSRQDDRDYRSRDQEYYGSRDRFTSTVESTITPKQISPRPGAQTSPGQLTESYYLRRERDKVSPTTEYRRQVHFGDSEGYTSQNRDVYETKYEDSSDDRYGNRGILTTYSNMLPSGAKSGQPLRGALFASLWD